LAEILKAGPKPLLVIAASTFAAFALALAFAALPSCVAISKDINPPVWMWLGGAIFGTAAHFINVIKDMDQDRASGIGGLPQRIGKRNSIVAAALLIALGILVLVVTI
jgi:4-hydroxybenzoate polyprenyltransferase